MSQPWYVTGAARPSYAQYSGWQQADAIRARTAALRQQQQAPAPQQRSSAGQQLYGSDASFQGVQRTAGKVQSWWNNLSNTRAANRAEDQRILQGKGPADLSKVPEFTWPWDKKNEGKPMKDWWAENVTERNDAIRDAHAAVTYTESEVQQEREEKKQKEKDEAKQAKQTAQIETYTDRAKARNALGYDREETFDELSLEEWNKLTPRQQAAVQFNADLFAAVEADRQLKDYTPSDEERSSYNDLLTERFGTTESSNPYGIEYAPNVAGLLQNANFIPQLNIGSIDDFIKMDVAISMEEVRRIDEQLGPTGRPDPMDPNPQPRVYGAANERLQRAQYLAKGQEQLGKTLAQGEALLVGMTGTSNSVAAQRFGGGLVSAVTPALDDFERERAEFYKTVLATPAANPQETIESMRLDMADLGFTPERQQIIVDTIMQESLQAASGQAQWYENNEQQQWLPPQEVAVALGAPRLGEV